MSERWTVARVMEWSEEYLRKAGIEQPSNDIQILMSEILGTSRMGVYLNHTKVLEETELSRFKEYLIKRREGVPLQYIIGKAYFYGRAFAVEKGCFIPQFCTETLVDKVVEHVKGPGRVSRILEIGGGSGALGITIAAETGVNVRIIEKEKTPARIIRKNIEIHGVTDLVRMEETDFFTLDDLGDADIMVSNPPYIASGDKMVTHEVREHIPEKALYAGDDGLLFYRRFAELKGTSDKDVLFFLEIGYNQAEAVKKIFSEYEVTLYKDLEGYDRVVKIV